MGVKAQRYRAEFMEPGIISYEDQNAGKVLVLKEAIDKMLASFIGCPVFNFEHKDTRAEDAFDFSKWGTLTDQEREDLADGIISAVGWNPETGWYWADMVIWDEETQNNLDDEDKKFSVSCAYTPTEVDAGGIYHNIEYDENVLNGVFTHMAVVDSPRYEGARVFKNNKGEGMNISIFRKKTVVAKKNAAPPPEEKKEETEEKLNTDGLFVQIGEEKIPVQALIDAYKATEQSEEPSDDSGSVLNDDDEMDVDGKKVKVSEMKAAYAKKNEVVDIMDEDAEEVVDEAKQKTNSTKPNENFKVVRNAAKREQENAGPRPSTRANRLAVGSKRYSLKTQGAK